MQYLAFNETDAIEIVKDDRFDIFFFTFLIFLMNCKYFSSAKNYPFK